MTNTNKNDDGTIHPGLQVERTTLAWLRTALAFGAVSALLLHTGDGSPWVVAPAVIGILMALALLLLSHKHHNRALRLIRANRSPMAPTLIATVSAGTTMLTIITVFLLAIKTS